ncbi:hypothetical protein L208DRAFT_1420317 [Tricholoma matsutake]|nr:hypothetical protein L208DRAFT_1420317 [Tricholoma matsutake 945]
MAAPADPFQLLHYNMVHTHDTFKRGCDIILSHLQAPPKDDLKNFLGYCGAWATAIEHHHDAEEAIVFPFLNTKMDFSGETEQHRVIHYSLEDLHTMIKEAQTDLSKFDVEKMKMQMIALKEPLYTHLDEEVEHIPANKMKEAGFAEHEVVAMIADLGKYARSHGDPFVSIPYMCSHTPTDIKPFWPPIPWILRKLIVPYIFAKKHSGYWKYSPYDMS